MKKKVLLTSLMIATFVCMFAISAFAAVNIDGIYYSFNGTEATVTSDNRDVYTSDTVVIPEKVTYEGVEYTVTKIAAKAFGSENSKKGNGIIKYVTIPATVTSIGMYAFGNCPEITTVDCKAAADIGERAFFDCNKLTTLTLENTKTIGTYTFTRIAVTSLVLPKSVTTVYASAFKGVTSLIRVSVLGETELVNNAFEGCSNLTEIFLTENIKPFNSAFPSYDKSKTYITYYAGSDTSDLAGICSSSRFKGTPCDYKDYVPEEHTGSMIIYNCNACDIAYNGDHKAEKDDGDCTTAVLCSVCEDYTCKEQLEHVSGERLTYASFMQTGEYYVGCTNDGCKNGTTTKQDALFTFLGYSAFVEDGESAITIGYSINNKAIEFYKSITSNEVDYGMYVVLSDLLGDDILNADKEPSNGVLKIDLMNADYSKASVKIIGIQTDAQKETKLSVGVYVAVQNDETKEIFYLENGLKGENDKYCYITYNYVAGIA